MAELKMEKKITGEEVIMVLSKTHTHKSRLTDPSCILVVSLCVNVCVCVQMAKVKSIDVDS